MEFLLSQCANVLGPSVDATGDLPAGCPSAGLSLEWWGLFSSRRWQFDEFRHSQGRGESLLSLCGPELRHAQGVERPLVADVDVFRRPEYPRALPLPVG